MQKEFIFIRVNLCSSVAKSLLSFISVHLRLINAFALPHEVKSIGIGSSLLLTYIGDYSVNLYC